MTYRPEIDGLRAIAVLAVMLYHAELPFAALPGGFLGVDIFFVISGYLITSIIVSEQSAGHFSYLSFYHRRARRLLPALLAVAFVTLVLGWLLLLPKAFAELGGSIASAILFVSNLFFLAQDSYVAESAHLKPFLHTWSLAVEEQFYLVYPMTLLLFIHHLPNRVTQALLVIAGVSFLGACYLTYFHDDWSFYLFPTRVWELMAGAILAMMATKVPETGEGPPVLQLPGLAGLLMIIGSFLFIDDSLSEPAVHTLVPVIGAALVIRYSSHANWAGKLLSNRALVAIGLISYSLYLWHQPLLVFARVYWFGSFSHWHAAGALALSIPVAAISWKFLEQPARNSARVPTPQFFKLTGFWVVIVLIYAVFASTFFLVPLRGTAPESGANYDEIYGDLTVAPSILVVGDSHGQALAKSLSDGFGDNAMAATAMIKAGCPYIFSVVETNRDCDSLNLNRRDQILNSEIRDIVIIARYTSPFEGSTYTNARGDTEPAQGEVAEWVDRLTGERVVEAELLASYLEHDILELIRAGKRIYLLDPVPELGIDPFKLWLSNKSTTPIAEPVARYLTRNRAVMAMNERLARQGAQLVTTRDIFCDNKHCYANRGGWLYFDDDHPSRMAGDMIANRLATAIVSARSNTQ